MYLTREEEKMLDGEYGESVRKFMELLVKLGEINGAERMIPVSSAQIAGISYKNIGDPGLEFLEEVSKDARVRIPSFMNPAGMDMDRWKELGIPEDFAEKQKRVVDALRRMGVMPTLTCTPYLAGILPRYRDHVAWAESSAVIYANSIIGARTNREGGPSALAAAVTGRTPLYGLHLDENRVPEITFDVKAEVSSEYGFSILAYAVTKHMKRGIPYFRGIRGSPDELKVFGATLAAFGGMALFHAEDITPDKVEAPKERIEIDKEELKEAEEEIRGEYRDVDLVVLGCPHASLSQLLRIKELLKGRSFRVPVWVFVAYPVKEAAQRSGLLEELEERNVKILSDMCAVVAPLDIMGIRTAVTNSGKMFRYLPSTNGVKTYLDSLENIVEVLAE
jgi:predicted aconitase